MDLVLIILVNMGYNRIVSDPHSRYTGSSSGFGINQIGGHGFQQDVIFCAALYTVFIIL